VLYPSSIDAAILARHRRGVDWYFNGLLDRNAALLHLAAQGER